MIKLADLYEKTSAKGNRYFIGGLNGARLLMFQNIDKQQESDPDWILYIQERGEQGKEEQLRTVTKPEGDFNGRTVHRIFTHETEKPRGKKR